MYNHLITHNDKAFSKENLENKDAHIEIQYDHHINSLINIRYYIPLILIYLNINILSVLFSVRPWPFLELLFLSLSPLKSERRHQHLSTLMISEVDTNFLLLELLLECVVYFLGMTSLD